MTSFSNSIQDGMKFYCQCQLESLYKLRIRESAQLKTVLELYDLEIHQKISVPNYQELKIMVKRSTDQKPRLRNSDARHGKIESGAVIKSRKGIIGVEGGKGISYQWKEKGQCSQGDRCSFRHETQERAQKPEHTAGTSSEPTLPRGRSVSRKRSIRGKSNHGAILRHTCRYYLKGICTRTSCECWHPPECQFYVVKPGISFCSRTRLMNNQTKRQRKATIHRKEEKAKTRMQWLV